VCPYLLFWKPAVSTHKVTFIVDLT
jgi:hypothetical protein